MWSSCQTVTLARSEDSRRSVFYSLLPPLSRASLSLIISELTVASYSFGVLDCSFVLRTYHIILPMTRLHASMYLSTRALSLSRLKHRVLRLRFPTTLHPVPLFPIFHNPEFLLSIHRLAIIAFSLSHNHKLTVNRVTCRHIDSGFSLQTFNDEV